MFASSFLRIPLHNGHPCSWLMIRTATLILDLHPIAFTTCLAHQKNPPALLQGDSAFYLIHSTSSRTFREQYLKLIAHITHSTTAHWRHSWFVSFRLIAHYTFSS